MSSFDETGLSGIPRQTAEAAAALAALQAPAEKAADAIEAAFTRAGASLTRPLAKAAADGKISLAELAQAVLAAVTAASRGGGLADALTSALGSGFSGARASGGPVSAGRAYLVGERGPEVFRPSGSGDIAPVGGGITVNLNLTSAAPETLLRSEAQIAQALARAVRLGAGG